MAPVKSPKSAQKVNPKSQKVSALVKRNVKTPEPSKKNLPSPLKKTPKSAPPAKRKKLSEEIDEKISDDEFEALLNTVKAKEKEKKLTGKITPKKAGGVFLGRNFDDEDDDEDDDDDIDEDDSELDVDSEDDDEDDDEEEEDDSELDEDDSDEEMADSEMSKILKKLASKRKSGDDENAEESEEEDDDEDDDDDDESEMSDILKKLASKSSNDEEGSDEEEDDDDDEDEDDDDDEEEEEEEEDDGMDEVAVKQKGNKSQSKNQTTQKEDKNTEKQKNQSTRKEKQEQQKLWQEFFQKYPEEQLLFVKSVPSSTSEEDLSQLSKDIKQVRFRSASDTSQKAVYLVFSNEAAATKNLPLLKKKKVKGQTLNIDFFGKKSAFYKSKIADPKKVDPLKLFVRGFARSMTQDKLKEMFPKASEVHMPMKRKGKIPLGFAFVNFKTASDCEKSRSKVDGQVVNGRKLMVLQAKAHVPEKRKLDTDSKGKQQLSKSKKIDDTPKKKLKTEESDEEDSDEDDSMEDEEDDSLDEDSDEEDDDDEDEEDEDEDGEEDDDDDDDDDHDDDDDDDEDDD